MLTDFLIAPKNNARPENLLPDWEKTELNAYWNLFTRKNRFFHAEQNGFVTYILGDPVNRSAIKDHSDIETVFKNGKGHFYLIGINPDKSVRLFSSIFGILPLFYIPEKDIISNSPRLLNHVYPSEIRGETLLEILLFNYPFGEQTIYKNINRVKSNTIIELSAGKLKFRRVFTSDDLFSETVSSGRNTLNELTERFTQTALEYFPDESYTISFTGGFDGRTLLSLALNSFGGANTFSFGAEGNEDVEIPERQAGLLNLPYKRINLSEASYIGNAYKESAVDFIRLYPEGNGFLYPHFLHSAKLLAAEYRYIVAGYFGSELFRALHLPGALISKPLIDLFRFSDKKEYAASLTCPELLHEEFFKKHIEAVIEKTWEYKTELPAALTVNQKFYSFVLEEIFPKFFGSWIYTQSHSLNIRTPFLDYDFIKALMKTEFAGVNNPFMVDNPFLRLKGQLLYTSIIRKNSRELFYLATGKGYRPADVYFPHNRWKILLPFIKKRLHRKMGLTNLDNLSLISGMEKIIDISSADKFTGEVFNSEKLRNIYSTKEYRAKEYARDKLLQLLWLKTLREIQ